MRELVDKSAKEDAKFNSLNGHLKQTVDTLNNLSAKVKKLSYKLNQAPPAVQ